MMIRTFPLWMPWYKVELILHLVIRILFLMYRVQHFPVKCIKQRFNDSMQHALTNHPVRLGAFYRFEYGLLLLVPRWVRPPPPFDPSRTPCDSHGCARLLLPCSRWRMVSMHSFPRLTLHVYLCIYIKFRLNGLLKCAYCCKIPWRRIRHQAKRRLLIRHRFRSLYVRYW